MKNLVSSLHLEIEEAVREGFDTFLSGMAEGIDLICAEIVFSKMMRGENVRLVCAIPFAGQRERDLSLPRDKYLHSLITAHCSVVELSEKYRKGCYKRRNEFMIGHSSRLIGAVKRKVGSTGTLQTIKMAEKAGLDMHILELDDNPLFYIDRLTLA